MAIGELVTRLTCDSSNFDRNINRSQREIQEFRRRTEQTAVRVNNTFNNLTSVTGRVGSSIGNLANYIEKLGPVVAVVGGAVKGLSEVVKRNEDLMDSWEKKVTQSRGALESFYTRLSQPDGFYRFKQNLKETISLLGDYADAQDNIGTFKGFSNVSNSKVNAAIAAYKEAKRNPESTPEQIAVAERAAKNAIEEADKVAKVVLQSYKDAFKAKADIIFKGGVGNNSISNKEAFGVISRFSTDPDTYNDVKNAARLLKDKSEKELLYSPYFKRLLKELGIKREGLFNPATFKLNIATIDNLRDFIVNLSKLVEQGNLTELQDIVTNINNQEYLLSTQKNAYYKQLEDNTIGKIGGDGVYDSKQEAPKERTLQDILDDLDKSLVWNKYLAQNLGEDITGANLSTLERTANELKDLLKNTTDEEQRKQILSVLKTINNTVNRPKEVKKLASDADFSGIYGNEIGNLSLNNDSRFYELKKIKEDKEIENTLRKSILRRSSINSVIKGVDINDIISPENARLYNYNASEFLKYNYNLVGKPSDVLNSIVQTIFNKYKASSDKYLNASLEGALNSTPTNFNRFDNKIKSFIPFGNLSKLNIPIMYPEEFYSSTAASSKFSSGVSSIVKKFTGFDNFSRDFAKNAYSEFDRLIGEDKIIKPEDVNKILYQVYLDTIKKHSSDTPDFFKNSSDFTKFVNDNISYDTYDSKVKLKLGEENRNALLYQELLNNIGDTKTAKVGIGSDLTNFNSNSKTVNDLDFTPNSVIELVNTLSKGNIYTKAEILDKIKKALTERRKILTEYAALDTSENEVNLNESNKRLRLIQLEKEKRSNNNVLPDDKLKEYEELIKEVLANYSNFSNEFLEEEEDRLKKAAEDQRKLIDITQANRKDLEDKINQTDNIGERIQKEEDENNVLRERQKELSEISNKYMSVADSAYQIGAAFSTLDSKFGDIASVLLNVVGITAEAIGKLIGMATAEGVSNAFKLPWPQNLAAVATVIAAGASAAGQIVGLSSRKYATGGIVSGPGTSISDSIPIRVSNGEMILNHRQQSNLFNLLDKGGSKSKLSSGEVEFKISGSSLVGVLRNYNNVNNKIR